MKFKAGDTITDMDFKRNRNLTGIIKVADKIGYIIQWGHHTHENLSDYNSHEFIDRHFIKINHYNTKLGKILYK